MQSAKYKYSEEAKKFIVELKAKDFSDDFDSSPAFTKTREHFKKETKDYSIPDAADHHTGKLFSKKEKGKQSSDRDRTKWLAIDNTMQLWESADSATQLKVFSAECARFDLGIHLPKGRTLAEDDSTNFITTFVDGATDYYSFFEKTGRSYSVYWKSFTIRDFYVEDLGRTLFFNYTYRNDDVTFSNILVKHNRAFPIDFDRLFWPITHKFTEQTIPEDTKIALYNSRYPQKTPIKLKTGDKAYLLAGQARKSIGKFTLQDYDSFPTLQDHLPTNWEFQDFPYEKHLADFNTFEPLVAEKHFATVKFFATLFFKYYLIEKIVLKEKLKEELTNYLDEAALVLLNAVKNSAKLFAFINIFKYEILKAILFEVSHYLLNSKHFAAKSLSQETFLLSTVAQTILEHFNILLKEMKCEPLEKDEFVEFRVFMSGLINGGKGQAKQLTEVKQFYLNLGFNAWAATVENCSFRISNASFYKCTDGAVSSKSAEPLADPAPKSTLPLVSNKM